MYSEMWKVSMTVSDTDAVAINDTKVITFTVPGVTTGDHVVSWGSSLDLSDGTDQATILFLATAANTITMYIQADVGEFAADALNGAVFKLVVGRPSW
jgi:hypothetical protein